MRGLPLATAADGGPRPQASVTMIFQRERLTSSRSTSVRSIALMGVSGTSGSSDHGQESPTGSEK